MLEFFNVMAHLELAQKQQPWTRETTDLEGLLLKLKQQQNSHAIYIYNRGKKVTYFHSMWLSPQKDFEWRRRNIDMDFFSQMESEQPTNQPTKPQLLGRKTCERSFSVGRSCDSNSFGRLSLSLQLAFTFSLFTSMYVKFIHISFTPNLLCPQHCP